MKEESILKGILARHYKLVFASMLIGCGFLVAIFIIWRWMKEKKPWIQAPVIAR